MLQTKCLCPPQNSRVEIFPTVLVFEDKAFGKEGKVLRKEIRVLTLRFEGAHLSLPLCEEPGNNPSSAGALVLNFPASRTMKNECLFFL